MHLRSLDTATLASTGGLGLNLFGGLTADQIVSAIGTALAVGGAAVSWYLSQRARIDSAANQRDAEARDEKRRQDLLDFEQRLRLRELERLAGPSSTPETPLK